MKFASKGSWVLIKNSHPGLVSPCAWDTGNFSGSGMNFDSLHASSETRWIPPLHPIPRWPAEWQAWTQAHTQTTKHVKPNVIRTGWTTVIRAYIHTQMQTHTFHLPTHLMWDLCFQLSRVRKEREMEMSDTGVNTEFSLLFGFVDFRSSIRGHQRSTVTQTSNVLQSLHHSHYCMILTIDMKQNQLRLMNKKKSINRKTQHKTSNHIQVRTRKKVKEKPLL